MLIQPNVRIRKVERIAGIDNYGEGTMLPIYSNVPACLQHKTEFFRTPNGDAKQIDGIMLVGGNIEVQADDVITLETPRLNQYKVFTAEEELGPNSCVVLRSLRLVKLVQEI
jgi:hypothetical protein